MLALFFTLSIALPQPGQKWIRAESANFTIVSSTGERETREVATSLEQLAGALRRVHARFDAKAAETKIFLFARRRDSQPYFDLLLSRQRAHLSGAYVSHGNRTGTMFVDNEHSFWRDRTVFHELMHNILSASGSRLPLWLEEGIAEYFSSAQIRGGALTVGKPVPEHQRLLRKQDVLPIAEVFAAESGSPIASHALFYPQSWAIVDLLVRTNREAFYRFVADIEAGATAETALRVHYGMEPRIVEAQLRYPLPRPSASTTVRVDRTPIEIRITQLHEEDAVQELGLFLGTLEGTRDDAERFLTANPGHARSLAGLGLLRSWQRKHEAVTPLVEQALELAPDDPVVLLLSAEALLRNSLGPFTTVADLPAGTTPRFRRARSLAMQAVKHRPSALADAIIGTSYLVEDDARAGVAPLERAHEARPGRIDYALNLYAVLLRAGDHDRAARLFDRMFARSGNPQATHAARNALIRENLRRANDLIGDEKLEDAAVLLREAVSAATDPSQKAELEEELRNLIATAEHNRLIVAYNEAVDATNNGEHEKALRLLDALLTTATDAGIISQARELREIVSRRVRRGAGMRGRRRAS